MVEWRGVPDLAGKYLISDHGHVQNISRGRILAGVRSGLRGDASVVLLGRRYRVCRLVCEAFHGPPPEGTQAAHLDGDFTNNAADNLAWVTPKENTAHKRAHGTHQAGEKHPRARLTEADVAAIRASKDSRAEIGLQFGISPWTVKDIRGGKRWKPASAVGEAETPNLSSPSQGEGE